MENVFIGKIVNTHGIKGEIRIRSDFERKSAVFKVGNEIIIRGVTYKIASYRVHKEFDMITLEGLNDINQVLCFKGLNVFVKRENLKLEDNDYLLSDLIDMNIVLNDENLGTIKDYTTGQNPLLVIENDDKTYYIPLKGNFIKSVDLKNYKIYVADDVKELMI